MGPLAPRFAQPAQHWQVVALRCVLARSSVPWGGWRLGAAPFEELEVPAARCPPSHVRIPGAPVLAEEFQHLQMPTFGCVTARARVPRLAPVGLAVQVLHLDEFDHVQVAVACCARRRCFRPGAALGTCPAKDLRAEAEGLEVEFPRSSQEWAGSRQGKNGQGSHHLEVAVCCGLGARQFAPRVVELLP